MAKEAGEARTGARLKKTIARNTTFNGVAQFVSIGTYFFLMPLIISQIGMTRFGLYVLAQSVFGYLGLLDLGASTALVKYVSQYHASEEKQKLRETIASIFVFYLGIGLIISTCLFFLATFSLSVFKLAPDLEVTLRQLLYVLALSALLLWPLSTFSNVLAGLQRYDLTAGVGILVSLATAGLTIFALSAGLGLVALVVVEATVSVAGSIILFGLAIRELGYFPLSWKYVRRQTAYSLAGFSLGAFLIRMGRAVTEKSDVIILGFFAPIASIALYEAANKLQALSARASLLVGSAVIPAASELESNENSTVLRDLYLRGSKYAAAATIAVTLSVLLLAKPLLVLWLGPEFARVTLPAQLLLSLWLVNASAAMTQAVLIGVGRYKLLSFVAVARALLNLGLSVFLVSRLGLVGVVLGTVISELVWLPVVLVHALRVLRIPTLRFVRRVIVPVYFPILLVALAGRALIQMRAPQDLLQLAGYALGLCLSYLSIFYVVGTDREEKRDLTTSLLVPAVGYFSALLSRKKRRTEPA